VGVRTTHTPWEVRQLVDEFGEPSAYAAFSAIENPIVRPSGVTAQIRVECDTAVIMLSQRTTLVGGTWRRDEYERKDFTIGARLDQKRLQIRMWTGYPYPDAFIAFTQKTRKVMPTGARYLAVSLPFREAGPTAYRFSLEGSEAAIARSCGQ